MPVNVTGGRSGGAVTSDDVPGRLVLVNGPSGVGKSSAAAILHQRVGAKGDVVVIEHDHFADMAGAQYVPASGAPWATVWKVALPPTIAACRSFLDQGLTVVLVITYGSQGGQARMQREFGAYDMFQLMLLPSWEVTEARIKQRIAERQSDRELQDGGWAGTRAFYDELAAMADAGVMDVVIDTSNMTPAEVATELERHVR